MAIKEARAAGLTPVCYEAQVGKHACTELRNGTGERTSRIRRESTEISGSTEGGAASGFEGIGIGLGKRDGFIGIFSRRLLQQ